MSRTSTVGQLGLVLSLLAAALAPLLWVTQRWLRQPLAEVEGLRYYRDAAGVAVFEGRIRNKSGGALRLVHVWLHSPDGGVAVEAADIGPGQARPFRRRMEGFPGWGRRGMTAEVVSVDAVPSPPQ